ncbi:hypothetical protein QYE76_036033 [Lolium multiflorum]|uniref:RNase H type-1 domain-containing protein n=1 Tax=Lolium multiflorum TaxID=4521 RepID=A0AAD8R085_LOLMU|nr:hypothetical protein QYE76_036033 [Lolium multiflorum]
MRNGLGACIVLTSPKGDRLDYVLQIHFTASNNVAEYEALIHGLNGQGDWCASHTRLRLGHTTSIGDWDAKDANMASYRFHVQQLSGFFDGCEFHHVPRANNEAADALSKIGSTRQAIPPGSAISQAVHHTVTGLIQYSCGDRGCSANRLIVSGFKAKPRLTCRTRDFSVNRTMPNSGLASEPAG